MARFRDRLMLDVRKELIAKMRVSRPVVDRIAQPEHGRSGFRHLLLRSVAEKVVRAAECPVLTIGPLEST